MRLSSLRRRNFITADHKLRLRFFIPLFLVLSFGVVYTINQFAIFSSAEAHITNYTVAEQASKKEEPQETKVAYASNRIENTHTTNNDIPVKQYHPALLVKKPDLNEHTSRAEKSEVTLASFYKTPTIERDRPEKIEIEHGQTVGGQLQKMGVPSKDAYNIVEALGEHFDPRRIRAGQAFEIEYTKTHDNDGVELKSVSKMTMPLSPAKQIVVYKEDTSFKAKEVEKEILTSVMAGRAAVKYSLYGSAAKANIPDEVIANMIKIFSWNVDFQRDIRSGDEIEILYETKQMEDGTSVGYGDILYARLVTGGKDISLYRHKKKDGHVDYFDPDGNSIKRTLMKTPIDGARVSSGYGMRHHPVLGYNKMHKGIDFAASSGTPIYAAGDGVIERAGRNGGYGNYVRIRHNSKLKTAYAHMQKIKSGLRSGSRVTQGQVIGYVGTTGRSTGPHLHYEVLVNNRQTNPRGINVPTGEALAGKELQRFKANKANFDQKFAALTRSEKYAAIDKTTY